MKLLVTGATGFVGRNLVLQALKENIYETIYLPVRDVAKLERQFKMDGFDSLPKEIHPIVTEAPKWDFSSLTDVDHVVHSAGVIFARTKQDYFETNVEGTVSLFKTLPKPKRVIVLSSQSASGPCPASQDFKQEEDLDSPLTWYGQSKLEMESRLKSDFSDLNYVCLRPPMIFGARDQATLPLFKMVKKRIFFKPGFKSKKYSFISVNDLVTAILAALSSPKEWNEARGKHFFVAQNGFITDRELLRGAAQVSAKKGVLLTVPQPLLWGVSQMIDTIPTWRATIPNLSVDRAKEIWPEKWVVSSLAFQKRFGWTPKEDFLTTLKDTRDWYLKSGQLT